MYGTHTVAVSFAMLDIMRNGAAWGYDLDPRTSHLWDRGTWGDARFLFWWFGWVAIEFNLTYVYSFLDTVMIYIYIDILYQGIATHANISMYTSYVCKYIYLICMYTYVYVYLSAVWHRWMDLFWEGYLWGEICFPFWTFFLISGSLLLCFSTFAFPCFSVCIVLCFSASPLCCLSAPPLFCFSQLFCFSASLKPSLNKLINNKP